LFSQEKFVALSDRFVCVKLATFERKEHQDMCEKLLGSVKNTSFTIFNPDATKTLVRPSRSPRMSFGGKLLLSGVEAIANQFKTGGSDGKTVLQDFHSLKQALVASSADQRLVVVTVGRSTAHKFALGEAAKVFNHSRVRGVAHFDQVTTEEEKWQDLVQGNKLKEGHFILQVEPFGRHAKVVGELPLKAKASDLLSLLEKANASFAKAEKRKVYHAHLKEGQQSGIRADTNLGRAAVRQGKRQNGR
jgi:hypothetical protein